MPGVGLVQADSAVGLINFTQGPTMGSTAMSSATASGSVTASQIKGAPQPQGPLSTAFLIPSTARSPVWSTPVFKQVAMAFPAKAPINADASQSHTGDALVKVSLSNDDTPTSSMRMSVGIDGDTTTQDAHFRSAQSIPNASNHPSTTAKPSITTDGLNIQVPNRKISFADSASTSVPFLDINNPLSPTFGTQARAITANAESQNILPSGFTPSKGSAPGGLLAVLAPQISDTQPSIASDSLLFHTTTMPTLSNNDKLPFLTMSGQTVTVDSLGQHSTDIQALTKSIVSTLSGTTISLAPNESAFVVGTSAATFDPSATAKFGSGSNGTEVQRFNGNALGARDGLWSSSMMLLVSFVLLLWL